TPPPATSTLSYTTLFRSDSISPGRNIRLIPYIAGSNAHLLDQPPDLPPLFRTNRDVRVGMDAKLVIRESLTLDATINPDFSQVRSEEHTSELQSPYDLVC